MKMFTNMGSSILSYKIKLMQKNYSISNNIDKDLENRIYIESCSLWNIELTFWLGPFLSFV